MTKYQGSAYEGSARPSRLLNRRNLLGGLAAVTAGVLTLPRLSNASEAGPRSASAAARQATAPDILTDEIYPIGFFYPPPLSETTRARYDEIVAAGFNLVLGGNDVFNQPANDTMLKVCADTGLRALPVEERINHARPCPDWERPVLDTLAEYQEYEAFVGFRIDDEPSPVDYPRYRMITDVLSEAAPQHLNHFNLRPVYDAGKENSYRQHLARYVEQVAPTFVSFDHYPLFTDGTVRETYFLNHMLVRESGLAAGLPTWTYIQSVDHWNLKRPNYAELAWQINMSLAYGCKGIQYFTYWTPVGAPDFEFGAALIDKQGQRTQVYHDASDINRTYLQPVGQQLKHLVSESVVHANDKPLPLGAREFEASDQLSAVEGDPLVLGQFQRPSDDSRRWLLVANRAHAADATGTLTVQPSVTAVAEFDPATGTYEDVALDGQSFTTSLDPGAGRLYRLTS